MSVLELEADIDYVTDNGDDPIEKVWVRNENDGSYEAFFPSSTVSELSVANSDLAIENARLKSALEALYGEDDANELLGLEKEVARLKAKMEEWARLFEDNARDHEQYGHWMEAEDWFEYAHDMRIDILSSDETEKVQA